MHQALDVELSCYLSQYLEGCATRPYEGLERLSAEHPQLSRHFLHRHGPLVFTTTLCRRTYTPTTCKLEIKNLNEKN